jgi:hypothetical protein
MAGFTFEITEQIIMVCYNLQLQQHQIIGNYTYCHTAEIVYNLWYNAAKIH